MLLLKSNYTAPQQLSLSSHALRLRSVRLRRRSKGELFFQADDGIRDSSVTGVQTCALPIFLGIAYLSLVLGELAPKRLALNNPERIAAAVAIPMRVLSRFASPVVRFLV